MVDGAPDGVWWVDLGAITDPLRVPRVVAGAVRALVEPAGDVVAMLAAQLRGSARPRAATTGGRIGQAHRVGSADRPM